MKKYYCMFCLVFFVCVLSGHLAFGLDVTPVYTFPPVTTLTPLTPPPFTTLTPPPYTTPGPTQQPDIAIINVLREFQYSSTSGTVYRYYVWVERSGGSLSAASVPVSIFTGYAYSDHGVQHTTSEMAVFPQGSAISCITCSINTRPLDGGEYPLSYVISFFADPDDDIAESNENNNTWICDSVVNDCAGCIGPDECYP
ncbi:MAG: hypothetical protein JW881_03840 [Spirochaetales bacterium]|nr:hypothetical protein [Spirochaetales bacterium]